LKGFEVLDTLNKPEMNPPKKGQEMSHNLSSTRAGFISFFVIPLTRGFFALVDNDDYNKLIKYKWFASSEKGRSTIYALRQTKISGSQRCLSMHRAILNAPKGVQVDHINHNGLDNRRANLRLCTRQQNQFNRKMQTKHSSSWKGVRWVKERHKWRSEIQYNTRTIHIGYFDSEIQAAKAYNKKAKKLFGEFANIN